jgi:dolichyl-phosphate-mannose--protein O-mannosyl transferase
MVVAFNYIILILIIVYLKMIKRAAAIFSISLLFISNIPTSNQTDFNEDDIYGTIENLPVTCSSTLRLKNVRANYYLHSSEISYGSGSGQQAVTGFDGDHDYNSLWTIKEGEFDNSQVPLCKTGQKIKCGETVRLEHMNSGRNLHSHSSFDSPVSGR